jgi:lactam utilization protein B
MAVATTTAQLEAVQSAITAVLANQSYTLDGRTVTRANLSALQQREDILLKRYNREVNKNRPRVSTAHFGGNF